MEKTQAALEPPTKPMATPQENLRKTVFSVLKIVVSAGLIFWILRGTNLAEIWFAFQAADFRLLALAFSLHIFGYMYSAFRWRLLLRSRGSDCSIVFLMISYLVGAFFNNLLPSTIGGDVYRAYDSYRLGQSKSSALAVVFVDRFLGLLALMVFALLALLSSNKLTENIPYLFVWVLLGTLGMSAFVWLIFWPPKWLPGLIANMRLPFGNKIKGIIQAFLDFEGQRTVLIKAFLWSVMLQANVILHYYLIALALGLPIPFLSFFLIIPLATVITMLPISVNGIGVRENIYIFFFASFAVTKPEAIAFAWAAYGVLLLQGVMGGIIYAFRKHRD
ncbi:MAG: UPF0104 family protein [Chloroflexi bacterium]|nr:MAG: UPF0104 family protein [Chloroflexota bacterium]